MNDKIYIYNPEQANFYMEEGCKMLKTGIHLKTKKTFWCFNKDECLNSYIKWCNRSVS